MSTTRATMKYEKFPFGINTDKSLNSIRDGELGVSSRNLRINKDDLVEKESGYKGVGVISSFPYQGSNGISAMKPNTINPFKILFAQWGEDFSNKITGVPNEDRPRLLYETLKNILLGIDDGQRNIFNFLEGVTLQEFNVPVFEVRRTRQTLSKELVNAEEFDTNVDSPATIIKEQYNQIIEETKLQILRQIISIKNNGDNKYSVYFINHTRFEPVRGVNSIKVIFEEYFRNVVGGDKERYCQDIAELLVSFSFVKQQSLREISDKTISLYITNDDEIGGKITSLTTINGGNTDLKFYSFDDTNADNIVKEIEAYKPRVEEILSTEAGIAGFNFANPIAFEEIKQSDFVFYGSIFIQGETDPSELNYSSTNTIYSSKSQMVDLKLLVGIDPSKTYTYDLKIRNSSTQYDSILGQYRQKWSDPKDFDSGNLNPNNPIIKIDQSKIDTVEARFELTVSEGGNVVSSDSIPVQLSSEEPTDYQDDFQNFAKCDKYGEFGTRIVKFGYKNFFFITQPLNSTYFNIKLQISNMDDGEEITDIKEFVNGNLIVLSQFRTWRLFSTRNDISDPTSWAIEQIADNVGSAFTYSTITIEQRLFVISQRGIFALTKDIYQDNNQSYVRIDHYNGKSYESTIEVFFRELIKKDVVSVKTDIRNSDFETTFVTYDNSIKKFINYRIKWAQDSSILRWLIDEAESEFDETTNKFDSALDIIDTEEIGGTKTAITLNGSIVEYDNDFYKFIDKTYVMKLITKNFDFGNAFNFKKIKEIDFVLFTKELRTQNVKFEHRIGNIVTTLDNLGEKNVQTSSNGEIQITNDDFSFNDFKERSEDIKIDGGFIFDNSHYDVEHYDETNIFHSRIRILGSHKDTVSGVAFYSESEFPIRLGGILFKLALKDKIKGNRQYVGNQNFRGPK